MSDCRRQACDRPFAGKPATQKRGDKKDRRQKAEEKLKQIHAVAEL